MSDFKVDLLNCDHEPIHIPGQIQSYGFLIVIDKDFTISNCRDNLSNFFPVAGIEMIGLS